jgi:hypothetical protein
MRYGRDYDRNFLERGADRVRGWFSDRDEPRGYAREYRTSGHDRGFRAPRYDRGYRAAGYDRALRDRGYDRGFYGHHRYYDTDFSRERKPMRGELEGWHDLGLRPDEYRNLPRGGYRGGMRGRHPGDYRDRVGGGTPGEWGPYSDYGLDRYRDPRVRGLRPGQYFTGYGVDQGP